MSDEHSIEELKAMGIDVGPDEPRVDHVDPGDTVGRLLRELRVEAARAEAVFGLAACTTSRCASMRRWRMMRQIAALTAAADTPPSETTGEDWLEESMQESRKLLADLPPETKTALDNETKFRNGDDT